jgi:hypothetical protein
METLTIPDLRRTDKMAKKEGRTVVRVDGEKPYVLNNSSNDQPFLGPKDYKQHRMQTKKHWDWEEGTPVFDETVRDYQTSGKIHDIDGDHGWDLHRGTISRDDEGRAHFSLDNPVEGFSNNKVMVHHLDPDMGKGDEAHQMNSGITKAVKSDQLTVHRGVHKYKQPERK